MECDLSALIADEQVCRQAVALGEYFELLWPEMEADNVGELLAAGNGRLPASALTPIPGGYLEHQAARRWLAMRDFIGRRHGVWIRPLGPNSSYRPYARQQYYWNLWRSGRGNRAAYPGTSNHGWGRAVDVATQAMAYYIRRYGARFGWSWDEGRRAGEWWHFRYVGGGAVLKPKPDPFKLLSDEEARHARGLVRERATMRRERPSGKGRKYMAARARAIRHKDWLLRRKRRLYATCHGRGPKCWKRHNRGARHHIIQKLVD